MPTMPTIPTISNQLKILRVVVFVLFIYYVFIVGIVMLLVFPLQMEGTFATNGILPLLLVVDAPFISVFLSVILHETLPSESHLKCGFFLYLAALVNAINYFGTCYMAIPHDMNSHCHVMQFL
jgi:hypothetical protein